jgi:hypothetical protein
LFGIPVFLKFESCRGAKRLREAKSKAPEWEIGEKVLDKRILLGKG